MKDSIVQVHNHPLFAVDSLGRRLDRFPARRQGKTVGVFYFLGSGGDANCHITDVTKILERDPEAYKSWDRWIAAGGILNAGTYWGKPLFGYYSHEDEWVILRHMRMMIEADVDYIIFDTTNNYICNRDLKKPVLYSIINTVEGKYVSKRRKNRNEKNHITFSVCIHASVPDAVRFCFVNG